MRWRTEIAKVAGLPPLELMEGFFSPDEYNSPFYFGQPRNELYDSKRHRLESQLPIKWDCLRPDPLYELLYHSDCDGEIPWESCGPIADRLEQLLPLLDGDGGGHIGLFREKTQTFIDGLRAAYAAKENVDFH